MSSKIILKSKIIFTRVRMVYRNPPRGKEGFVFRELHARDFSGTGNARFLEVVVG